MSQHLWYCGNEQCFNAGDERDSKAGGACTTLPPANDPIATYRTPHDSADSLVDLQPCSDVTAVTAAAAAAAALEAPTTVARTAHTAIGESSSTGTQHAGE